MKPRELITLYFEAWNRCDVQALTELLSGTLVGHEGDRVFSREDVIQTRVELNNDFPDLVVVVKDLIESADGLTVHWSAVNKSDPANQKTLKSATTIYRLQRDKIEELWDMNPNPQEREIVK